MFDMFAILLGLNMFVPLAPCSTNMISLEWRTGIATTKFLLSGSMLHSIGFAVRPVGVHLFDSEFHDHVALQISGDKGNIINYDPCNPNDNFAEPKGDILFGDFAPDHG